MHFMTFHFIYGMSSFPLTHMFQDGFLNHQPVYISTNHDWFPWCCFFFNPETSDLSFLGYHFSGMRSEGFPFIIWGSGGWTLVRLQLVVFWVTIFFDKRILSNNVANPGRCSSCCSSCENHVFLGEQTYVVF